MLGGERVSQSDDRTAASGFLFFVNKASIPSSSSSSHPPTLLLPTGRRGGGGAEPSPHFPPDYVLYGKMLRESEAFPFFRGYLDEMIISIHHPPTQRARRGREKEREEENTQKKAFDSSRRVPPHNVPHAHNHHTQHDARAGGEWVNRDLGGGGGEKDDLFFSLPCFL